MNGYYNADKPEELVVIILEINHYRVVSHLYNLTPEVVDHSVRFYPNNPKYAQLDVREYEFGKAHDLKDQPPFEYLGFIIDRVENEQQTRAKAREILNAQRLRLIADLATHTAKLSQMSVLDW
jgi:hypothetical protein